MVKILHIYIYIYILNAICIYTLPYDFLPIYLPKVLVLRKLVPGHPSVISYKSINEMHARY